MFQYGYDGECSIVLVYLCIVPTLDNFHYVIEQFIKYLSTGSLK
jgi:hypothetical protein